MPKQNDYPYIRAWGRYLGSDLSYIEGEVERARESGAPANATSVWQGSGPWDGKTWRTLDNIADETLRERIKQAGDALAAR